MPYGARPPIGAVAGPQVPPLMGQVRPIADAGPGVALTIDAWLTDSMATVADGAQNPTVSLPTVPAGHVYLIDRVSVFTTSAAPTWALFLAGPDVDDGLDYTTSGNRDAGGFLPAIVIAAGATFTIAWTGGGGPTPAAGTQCLARVQYRLATIHPGGAA